MKKLLLVTLVVFAASVQPAGATTGTMTLTSSTRLTQDHYGSIVIAAPLTLDCAGHSIIGPGPTVGAGAGVSVNDPFGTWTRTFAYTIRRCRIAGFDRGIDAPLYSTGSTVSDNVVTGNRQGIWFYGDNGSVVRNLVGRNAMDGIGVTGVGNRIAYNTASDNGLNGFDLFELRNSQIAYNIAARNAGDGFEFRPSFKGTVGLTVTGNAALSNSRAGFYLNGTANSAFTANIATGNDVGMQTSWSQNCTFRWNAVFANHTANLN